MKRKKIIRVAKSYDGCRKYSAKHKELVSIFNTVKPNGYTAHLSDPWCAIAVTAWAIKAYGRERAKKYFPLSAGVPDMVNKSKNLGIWIEKDKTVPMPGDWIIYDWDDSGKGNCKGSPDHVGLVIEVRNTSFLVEEGNKGHDSRCGVRWMDINGRYIRGFIRPEYNADIDDIERK